MKSWKQLVWLLGAGLALVWMQPAGQAQVSKPAKKEAVEGSAVQGVELGPDLLDPVGRGTNIKKPTIVENEKQIAKAFSKKEAQAKIKELVDFEKNNLIIFAWRGSGGDRLTAKSVPSKKKGAPAEIVFLYQRGFTRDLRSHRMMFQIPKKSKWSLGNAKPRAIKG